MEAPFYVTTIPVDDLRSYLSVGKLASTNQCIILTAGLDISGLNAQFPYVLFRVSLILWLSWICSVVRSACESLPQPVGDVGYVCRVKL